MARSQDPARQILASCSPAVCVGGEVCPSRRRKTGCRAIRWQYLWPPAGASISPAYPALPLGLGLWRGGSPCVRWAPLLEALYVVGHRLSHELTQLRQPPESSSLLPGGLTPWAGT